RSAHLEELDLPILDGARDPLEVNPQPRAGRLGCAVDLPREVPEERAQVEGVIEVDREQLEGDNLRLEILRVRPVVGLEDLVEDALANPRVGLLPPAQELGVEAEPRL